MSKVGTPREVFEAEAAANEASMVAKVDGKLKELYKNG